MPEIAFTLCSNNYLAQAKTLADSFIRHNPEFNFIIGLVDKRHPEIDYDFFRPHQILEVDQLGIPGNESMVSKYNIVEYNTAVKPFFFQYIFENFLASSVTYFDPDIKVYAHLDLEHIYTTYDFILTPHLLMADPNAIPFREQMVLNVGIFNLGFLGLKRSAQSDLFLRFLQTRLRDKCYIDFCNGLFVDQIWANLIPCYFEDFFIWKDPGCNVGYWNFSERLLSYEDSVYKINGTHSLKFFHISNYDPLKPDRLCRSLPYSFDLRPDLKLLYDEYRKELVANKYTFFRGKDPLFTFKNHPIVNKKLQKKVRGTRKRQLSNRLKQFANRVIDVIFG